MPKLITEEFLHKKVFSRYDMGRMFKQFYDVVKHGDKEHKKWLLEETLKFIGDKLHIEDKHIQVLNKKE